MELILFVFSGMAFIAGSFTYLTRETVLHEMLAGILFIISAIFLAGGGTVNEIRLLRKHLKKSEDEIRDELKKLNERKV